MEVSSIDFLDLSIVHILNNQKAKPFGKWVTLALEVR
jgi:hypothetical protein